MVSLNSATLLSGNGIDVNSLVTQVLAPENSQLQLYQQQQSDLQNQASLLGGINNDLNILFSAVNSLSDFNGPLAAQTATSTQPSIVTASAQSSAVPGTHNIEVNTLATQGTLYTDAVTSGDASVLPANAQSADLKFQVGGSSGPTRDVPISPGSNDTLNKIVSYINSQNWGVNATVLNDASGARLAIFSQNTGSTGALAITNNTSSLNFNAPIGGTDASFTVDGVPFSSTTNTASGAIPGVTLDLVGGFPGIPAQVSVGSDTSQASQAIANFVSAYNKVIGDINQQFTVDPTSGNEGPLGSDSSLRSLQSSLLADATYSLGNGSIASLSSLGITTNDDGTLSVDSAQLNNALSSNPSAVLNFFQNSAQTGFADNFANDLQNLTDPTQGVLSLDLSQNQQQQLDLTNTINNFQDRMSAQQTQLSLEFSQVNALIEEYPFLLEAVDLQLGITPSGSTNTAPATGSGGSTGG